MLAPIVDPPFYAVELSPSMLNTQGGPRRNEKGQVVRPDGSAIPRLYSAGELGSIYSYLYQGTGNIRGMPGVRAHFRAQRRRRDALGIATPGEHGAGAKTADQPFGRLRSASPPAGKTPAKLGRTQPIAFSSKSNAAMLKVRILSRRSLLPVSTVIDRSPCGPITAMQECPAAWP
jgi:hypothetical protein